MKLSGNTVLLPDPGQQVGLVLVGAGRSRASSWLEEGTAPDTHRLETDTEELAQVTPGYKHVKRMGLAPQVHQKLSWRVFPAGKLVAGGRRLSVDGTQRVSNFQM